MVTRNTTTQIILVCLLIFTFPIWIGICSGVFGILIGAFSVVFGVLGAVLGIILSLLALPFKILAGSGLLPGVHVNQFTIAAMLVFIIILLIRRKKIS